MVFLITANVEQTEAAPLFHATSILTGLRPCGDHREYKYLLFFKNQPAWKVPTTLRTFSDRMLVVNQSGLQKTCARTNSNHPFIPNCPGGWLAPFFILFAINFTFKKFDHAGTTWKCISGFMPMRAKPCRIVVPSPCSNDIVVMFFNSAGVVATSGFE